MSHLNPLSHSAVNRDAPVFLALWSPCWNPTMHDAMTQMMESLFAIVPRVVVDDGLVWCDVRGLPVRETAERLVQAVTSEDCPIVAGVATTPIIASVAAQQTVVQQISRGAPHGRSPRHQTLREPSSPLVTMIAAGTEHAFLASLPISVLRPDPMLANLLDGAGIETCGDLASLTRESIEVRFGREGAQLWRLSRADDPRPMFGHMPRTLPVASLEWTDYVVRRAERLVFIFNALCGNVCDALRELGEGAVSVVLRFSLANRTVYEYPLRAGRATASHTAWMRLIRLALETITLPDVVTGLTVQVTALAGVSGRQGSLFDMGFATASAAEAALAHVTDDHGDAIQIPIVSEHPLLDRRTAWETVDAFQAVERATPVTVPANISARMVDAQDTTELPDIIPLYPIAQASEIEETNDAPALTLQLLPTPRRIAVMTVSEDGREQLRSYRDAGCRHTIVDAAGPDRVSGDVWETAYAREYFRCVNEEGMLVWLYRDARTNVWYLHGWWD